MGWLLIWTAIGLCPFQQDEPNPELQQRVRAIVASLDDPDPQKRTVAAEALRDLDPAATEILDKMYVDLTPEAQGAISRVQRAWDEQRAQTMFQASRVELQGKQSVSEALQSLGKQAGITLIGDVENSATKTYEVRGAEFFRGLDQVLEGSALRMYPYGAEEGELRIIATDEPPLETPPPVCYDGAFRIEALRCESTKDFQRPAVDQLRIVLGVSWEPRLKPIAILEPMSEITAKSHPDKEPIPPLQNDVLTESVVQAEIPFAEVSLPFHLPAAATGEISELAGTLYALLPGAPQSFLFEDLDESSTGIEQRKGGLIVRLDGWQAEDNIYSVLLHLQFDDDAGALDSFRTWIAGNEVHLEDGMGTKYKPVGREISQQANGMVAMRFLFTQNPINLNLVVQSPTNIFRMPIKIELHHIIIP